MNEGLAALRYLDDGKSAVHDEHRQNYARERVEIVRPIHAILAKAVRYNA